MSSKDTTYRFKMEDYDMKELVDAAGWSGDVKNGELVQTPFKRKSATKSITTVSWEEIRNVVGAEWEEKVWDLAVSYGYDREIPHK